MKKIPLLFKLIACALSISPTLGFSQIDTAKTEADARAITETILKRAPALDSQDPISKMARSSQRRADQIASEALESQRSAVREYLGIAKKEQGVFYVFVSKSMPTDMVRAYALESSWAGGSLVYRGISPGQTLMDFMKETIYPALKRGETSMAANIDPRLYERYGVTTVPAIVYDKDAGNFLCDKLCPRQASDRYWKVEGQVSVYWALEEMKRAGAPVDSYMTALAKGIRTNGFDFSKEIKGPGDRWPDLFTPGERMALDREKADAAQKGNKK